VPKLHQSAHLTLLSAGREKRLYAVPPYTDVRPLEFDDVPFRVEQQRDWVCYRTGAHNKFMNEIPQQEGGSTYEISDSGYVEKLLAHKPTRVSATTSQISGSSTYYDDDGRFYINGYLK